MHMYLGETYQPPPETDLTPWTKVCVESANGGQLRTGWGVAGVLTGDDDVYVTVPTNDDVQEVPFGDPANASTVIISPSPNGSTTKTTPAGDNIQVPAILVNLDATKPTSETGTDTWYWAPVSGNLYILPGPNRILSTFPGLGDKSVQVIVGGPLGTSQTSVPVKETIQIGKGNDPVSGQIPTNNTSVWGPVRASQRPGDQLVTSPPLCAVPVNLVLNPDQIPSAVAPGQPATSGVNGNGDVSWSPQFTFRSRFFKIYVLGRGLVRLYNPINPQGETLADEAALLQNLKFVGERRVEAVYDALKDQIIWQRAPASEKRSLADP